MNKSICLFTNFWDANNLIDKVGYVILEHESQVYKVNLKQPTDEENGNFSIYSIALSKPDLSKLPHLRNAETLDFFCPTYDILKKYKEDSDWVKYCKDFHALMHKRNDRLKKWMDNLVEDHVYILCCWENTSRGANCHRQLLYKAMLKSSNAMKKVIPIYRHGNEKQDKTYNRELNPYNYGYTASSGNRPRMMSTDILGDD